MNYQVPSDVPILDKEQIDMLVEAGDSSSPAFLQDLLDTFESEFLNRSEAIRHCCATGDIVQLRHHVHFIAGSSSNIGFLRLSILCRNLEKAIDEGVLNKLDDCFEAVAKEHVQALDLMKKRIAEW